MPLPVTSDLWFHGDASLLTGASGAAVVALPDLSGNGRDAAATGTPTLVAGGQNGRNVVDVTSTTAAHCFFNLPAVDGTLAADGWTVFLVIKPLGFTNAWYAGTTSAYFGYTNNTPAPGTRWTGGGAEYGRVNSNSTSGYMLLTARQSRLGTTLLPGVSSSFFGRATVDQFAEIGNSSAAVGLPSGQPMFLPWLGSGNDHVVVAEVLVYSAQLTYTQEQQVSAYLAEKWGLWRPQTHVQVEGNSTSQQGNLSLQLSQLLDSLNPSMLSLAISGSNTLQMSQRVPEATEAQNYWGGRNSYAVYHTGHNEGFLLSTTRPFLTGTGQTSPNLTFRANGGRAMVCTGSTWNGDAKEGAREGTPGALGLADGLQYQSGWGNQAGSLNNWLRDNWPAYFDGFFDLGATHEFGCYDNGTPAAGSSRYDFPSYWVDAVHHTVAGQAAKAAMLAPVIKAMAATAAATRAAAGDVRLSLSGRPAGWGVQWYRYSSTPPVLETATRGVPVPGMTSDTPTDATAAAGTSYWYTALMTAPAAPYAGLAYGVPAAAWSRPLRVDVPAAGNPAGVFGVGTPGGVVWLAVAGT